MLKKHRLQSDEQGFASIVIALLLITILALLTVGFAQLARREQQSALDKELATQATDAAESGINDAWQDIQNGTITDTPPATPNINSNNCLGAPLTHSTISSTYNVGYKCVLVNLKPPALQWDNVSEESQRYITFSTDDVIDNLNINWGSADQNNKAQPSLSTGFLPRATWKTGTFLPVMEVSLTPLTGDTSRCGLINNSFTIYLYPASGGLNSVVYSTNGTGTCNTSPSSASEGAVVSGDCTTSGTFPCSASITGLNGFNTGPYLLRVVSHYDGSNISVDGRCGVAPVACHFIDGQAVIDATGQAKNVSKRLEVHVPLKKPVPLPTDSVEGQNVCKEFDTYPGGGNTAPQNLPGCSLN